MKTDGDDDWIDLFVDASNQERILLISRLPKHPKAYIIDGIARIMECNDPIARSLALRCLKSLARLAQDRFDVHHSVRRALASDSLLEAKAALIAANSLSLHIDFCRGSMESIYSLVECMAKDDQRRAIGVRLILLFQNMSHDFELAQTAFDYCKRAQGLCLDPVWTSACLHSRTVLACQATILTGEHFVALVNMIPNSQISSGVLKNLYILSQKHAHLFKPLDIVNLLKLVQTLPCQGLRILLALVANLLARPLIVKRCMQDVPCKTGLVYFLRKNVHLFVDAKEGVYLGWLLARLADPIVKSSIIEPDMFLPSYQTLLTRIQSQSVSLAHIKTFLVLSTWCDPTLSWCEKLFCPDRPLEWIVKAYLSQKQTRILHQHALQVIQILSRNGLASSLPGITLISSLLRGAEMYWPEFGTGSLANVLSLETPMNGWTLYNVAQDCITANEFGVASRFLNRLVNHMSNESTQLWILWLFNVSRVFVGLSLVELEMVTMHMSVALQNTNIVSLLCVKSKFQGSFLKLVDRFVRALCSNHQDEWIREWTKLEFHRSSVQFKNLSQSYFDMDDKSVECLERWYIMSLYLAYWISDDPLPQEIMVWMSRTHRKSNVLLSEWIKSHHKSLIERMDTKRTLNDVREITKFCTIPPYLFQTSSHFDMSLSMDPFSSDKPFHVKRGHYVIIPVQGSFKVNPKVLKKLHRTPQSVIVTVSLFDTVSKTTSDETIREALLDGSYFSIKVRVLMPIKLGLSSLKVSYQVKDEFKVWTLLEHHYLSVHIDA